MHFKSLAAAAALVLAASTAAANTTFQTTNVRTFATAEMVDGAATLIRTDEGIRARLALTGLDKKKAYSIWWIVFNEPEQCVNGVGGCTGGDIGPGRPADPAVMYAAGFLTGTDGIVNLTAELEAGVRPEGIGPGFSFLRDSHRAEVHLLVVTHGRPLTGAVNDQITTPNLTCNPECENQYGIRFPPIED